MTPVNPHRPYYPALDGLRGVAILLVVFLHNFRFVNYFFFGWLGVDLFFVLSGFLITEILLKTLGQPNYLRNFYMRRMLRIFPIYYLTLIICFGILPSIIPDYINVSYYTANQVWIWTYLQNWLFTFKDPYGTKMLLHTWSLAVEEQFYILWPVAILLIKRAKILLVVMLAVLLITGITRYAIWEYDIKDLAYASLYTFTRIDGLCIGAILALLIVVNPEFLKKYTFIIVLILAAINFGFYFINDHHSFSLPYLAFVGYTTFAVLFGILVHEAITGQSKIINLIFNNSILKFFGKISYGLYVYHWPVYILLFPFFSKLFLKTGIFSLRIAELGSACITTVIAVILSLFSYHYIERFFLKYKDRYASSTQ